MGAELLFNCQLVYISCGTYSKVPFLANSIGSFYRVTGFLFFYSEEYKDLFSPFSDSVRVSPCFLENSLLVTSLLFLSVILIIILGLYQNIIKSNQSDSTNTSSETVKTIRKVIRFIYRYLLFPFVAGFCCLILLSGFLNNMRVSSPVENSFPSSINSFALLFSWMTVAVVIGI